MICCHLFSFQSLRCIGDMQLTETYGHLDTISNFYVIFTLSSLQSLRKAKRKNEKILSKVSESQSFILWKMSSLLETGTAQIRGYIKNNFLQQHFWRRIMNFSKSGMDSLILHRSGVCFASTASWLQMATVTKQENRRWQQQELGCWDSTDFGNSYAGSAHFSLLQR